MLTFIRDFQKLIFYYYADHYINFKDLITELYRIYKTRIWMSAINPASFSQHAVNQPPSGIGPGAVAPYNPYANNQAYTMAYGEDRDPYGAQIPYHINYDTYTPNYPGIPGVTNSFAPPIALPAGQNYAFYGSNPPQQQPAAALPAAHPPSSYLGHGTFSGPGGPAFTGSRGNAFAVDPSRYGYGNDLMPVPEDGNMQADSPATPDLNAFSQAFPYHLTQNTRSSQSPQTPSRKQSLQSQAPIGTRSGQFGANSSAYPTFAQQLAAENAFPASIPRGGLPQFGQHAPIQKDSASPEVTISGLAELGSAKKANDEEKINKAERITKYIIEAEGGA